MPEERTIEEIERAAQDNELLSLEEKGRLVRYWNQRLSGEGLPTDTSPSVGPPENRYNPEVQPSHLIESYGLENEREGDALDRITKSRDLRLNPEEEFLEGEEFRLASDLRRLVWTLKHRGGLNTRELMVYVMRWFALTQEEIAEGLSCSERTVIRCENKISDVFKSSGVRYPRPKR